MARKFGRMQATKSMGTRQMKKINRLFSDESPTAYMSFGNAFRKAESHRRKTKKRH